MKRVVLYLRVSLDNGVQDTERQLNDLTNYCNNNDYEIVEVFKDKISGKTDITQREGLTNLYNFVSNKENFIDGILVTELSRLGRDLQSSIKLIDDFTKMRIFVYSQSENLKTLNDDKTENDSRMIMDIMLVLSQNERKKLIQRVKSGLKTKLLKDNSATGGMVLYGYKSINKQMIIDEEESKWVKKVFEMYLEGYGTTLIANYLNENNVPTRLNKTPTKTNKSTGKIEEKKINLKNGLKIKYNEFRWSDSTVYFMLTNTTYKGYRIYNEETTNGIIQHKVKQPQIVDTDIFDKVQEKLKSGFNKKDNSVIFNYIFENGLVKCGVCGRSYYPHNRVSGNDSTFKCLSKRYRSNDCDNIGVGISKLYSSVWYFLRRLDELKDILKENRKESDIEKNIQKLELTISLLNNQIEVIETNEKTIIRMLLNNQMSETNYSENYKELQTNKNKLQSQLKNIQNELDSIKDFDQKQLTLLEQIRDLKSDRTEMKKIVKLLVKQIVVYPVINKTLSVSDIKNDTHIYIKLFLYTSPDPINFIISRYSMNILQLSENDYNSETGLLNIDINYILRKKDNIRHKIESNVLL